MRNSTFVGLVCALAGGLSLSTAMPAAEAPRPSGNAKPPVTVVAVPTQQATLVRGNNRFALELYAKLRDSEGNLFLSPYSISSALAMTAAGARGETARQMKEALRLTQADADLHAAFGGVTTALNESGKKGNYQLSVANALWAHKNYKFLDPFLGVARGSYGAGVQAVDFAASEEARKTINTWVEKETRDRIKDLIKPGTLDGLTRLVLTNAIYFKGLWQTQFKKEDTGDEPFHNGDGTSDDVPMMRKEGAFGLFQNERLQVLELPYKGEEVSMLVLLPRNADGLPALEKTLTADTLERYVTSLSKTTVDVALPRWKVTSEFQLGSALQSLGMTDAFTPRKADFSGMDGTKELFIGAAVHKAFVEVNEEGTEAAAATGIVMRVTSAPMVPQFRADHPFLFLIRDQRTGSILFIGRVTDPKV